MKKSPKLAGIPGKTRSEGDARAVHGPPPPLQRGRSSSSSGTTRGACTTTSGSSATACSPAGRCRRASRSSPGRSTSPSTSRTIRSTTPTFEGEIPKGQYGAGTVEIWDRGTYELVEDKPDGGLTVRLHGEKLDGLWALVPAHLSGHEKNWLIVRKREQASDAPRVATRRYEPMLATLADDLPHGDDWLFEPKWDGYRALAYVREGEVELRSRRDNDLTERFAEIARALPRGVRTPSCVLDGEVCALDDAGRSSFSLMQQGLGRLVYYVFDVLEVDAEPVLDRVLDRAA